jgi:hypothetical protein
MVGQNCWDHDQNMIKERKRDILRSDYLLSVDAQDLNTMPTDLKTTC